MDSASHHLRNVLIAAVRDCTELPESVREAVTTVRGLEESTFDATYLDFLDEQIELNARGEEWSDLLRRRRNALADWCDRSLVIGYIIDEGDRYTFWVEPSSRSIVYWEAEKQFPPLRTNRDLCKAISELIEQQPPVLRTLEAYLTAVWSEGRRLVPQASFSLYEFFDILFSGFAVEPPEFNEKWRSAYQRECDNLRGFEGWESTILRQIVDLHEMNELGTLGDKQKQFGAESPRGEYWYNFDPYGYLDCATEGFLLHLEPEDPSSVELVRGDLVVMGSSSEYELVPAFPVSSLSWDEFREFLELGQRYE